MPIVDPTPFILVILGIALGAGVVWYVGRRFRKRKGSGRYASERVVSQTIAERVRSVGKLVALEVAAKEITTASSGWGWLPPLILSQARIAMIFHFEKQYSLDLAAIRPEDVTELGPGRFRLRLPPMDGALRLIDMTPYDIQAARILGLLDLMPMTADRQRELMKKAQAQAASIFEDSDTKYLAESRASAERHLRSLLELMEVKVEFTWQDVEPVEKPAPLPTQTVSVRPRLALPITLSTSTG